MKTVKSIVESNNSFFVTFEDGSIITYQSGDYLNIVRGSCCLTGTVSVECLIVGDQVKELVDGRQHCGT